MTAVLEMLIGVLAGRRIAASDVAADQAFAQLHPALTRLKTFRAALVAGRYIVVRLLKVFAARHLASLLNKSFG
jgi:hypothetical protein